MRIIHQTKEIGITDWLFIWTAFSCICLNYTMYICSNYVYRYCICVNYLCTFMSYCASHEGNWHRWLIVHLIAVLLKKSKEVDTLRTYLYPFSLFILVFLYLFQTLCTNLYSSNVYIIQLLMELQARDSCHKKDATKEHLVGPGWPWKIDLIVIWSTSF